MPAGLYRSRPPRGRMRRRAQSNVALPKRPKVRPGPPNRGPSPIGAPGEKQGHRRLGQEPADETVEGPPPGGSYDDGDVMYVPGSGADDYGIAARGGRKRRPRAGLPKAPGTPNRQTGGSDRDALKALYMQKKRRR